MQPLDDADTTGLLKLKSSINKTSPYLVICLLSLAIVIRMIYGYGLNRKSDEVKRIEFIRTVSFQPGKINLPMGSAISHHPPLSAYIAVIGYRLSNGSIYGIRTVYVFLSVFGLWGLFCLARELFGYRAGIIALFLGVTDHHLISYAPEFLEPVYLCLVPWLILSVYRAVALEMANYWITIGIIGGLGYMCSEIFLLLTLPIVVIVLFSGRAVSILKTKQLYVAGFVLFLIITPSLVWNYNHEEVNIIRHAERVNPIGPTLRLFLLYLGDLLINLKKSSHVVISLGNTIYGPWSIPCHWTAGVLYFVSLVYALKYITNRRHAYLFAFIFGVGVPVSLLNAKEPWNEIEWGAMTIFPVICLTSWAVERFVAGNIGRCLSGMAVIVISAYTAGFLYGPKCGYASPFWEKAFLGDVLYYSWIKNDNKTALELVEDAVKKHPDCAVAHYFKGKFSSDPQRKKASYQKALLLEPFNPIVYEDISRDLIANNKNFEAHRLLAEQISFGNEFFTTRFLLSKAAFNLGNYAAAENHLEKALKMKPDAFHLYENLFYIMAVQGKFEEGLTALDRYAMSTGKPEEIYQKVSQSFSRLGQYDKAGKLYQKALEKNSNLQATPSWETTGP